MASFVFLIVAMCIAMVSGKGYYRAAVVEYDTSWNTSNTADANLMNNVNRYDQIINSAQQNQADIIVFPEGGLLGSNDTLFLEVPSPSERVVPSNSNKTYHKSLQQLSQYAQKYQLYLVVNVLEQSIDRSNNATSRYSTSVVFDKKGMIVARYRKYNMLNEKWNVTHEPDYSIFTTDFGVTFGLFSSSDIFFQEPALTMIDKKNVKDFVYTSWWTSELPFQTSVQAQWSWAYGNGVNLLAAGYNDPLAGNGGSGIYKGKTAESASLTFTGLSGSVLIVDDVSIDGCVKDECHSGKPFFKEIVNNNGYKPFKILSQQDVKHYVSENISLPVHPSVTNLTLTKTYNRQLCHGILCCQFKVEIVYDNKPAAAAPPVFYRAIVFNGTRTFLGANEKTQGAQLCAVVACSSENITSCGASSFLDKGTLSMTNFSSVDISGNFKYAHSEILPNILIWPHNNSLNVFTDDLVVDYNHIFSSNEDHTQLILSPGKQLVTVGIHSWVFPKGNGAQQVAISTFAMSLSTMLIGYLLFCKED